MPRALSLSRHFSSFKWQTSSSFRPLHSSRRLLEVVSTLCLVRRLVIMWHFFSGSAVSAFAVGVWLLARYWVHKKGG